MGKQTELALVYAARSRNAREGGELRMTAIEVAHWAEKEGLGLAAELDVDPGQFSRALYGRGIHFDIAWLPALIHVDPEHRLLRKAASFVRCEVSPKKELTPEEALARVLRELRNSGAAGEAILRRALGDDTP